MARPIEPTPILYGEDARRFIRLTLEAERTPNPKRLAFLRECEREYLKHPF